MYATQWECTNTATTTCTVLATSTVTDTELVGYHDWLFVAMIQTFVLCIMLFMFIFSLFRK